MIKETYYICKCCGEEWDICSEDYDNYDDVRKICSFCSMSISQLLTEVDISYALFIIYKRIIFTLKKIIK